MGKSLSRVILEREAFTFTLPLGTTEKEIPVEEKTSVDASGNQHARILLVDDEPMIREMITMMLARHGCKTEIAESGAESVEKWENGKFDLILMDLQMSEINSLEATRVIRERETGEGKRICIIGMKAHARRDVMDDCLKAEMDRVLTKPVQMMDLQAAINFCCPNNKKALSDKTPHIRHKNGPPRKRGGPFLP